jgi:hypothetical protein
MAESPNAPRLRDNGVRVWAGRLARSAAPAIPDLLTNDAAAIDRFSDEQGFRRPIDRAVLARVFGRPPGAMPAPATPDLAWWWALTGESPRPSPPPAGPITAPRHDRGIELWTEIELGALHAATSLALDRGDEQLLGRCLDACAWHVAEIEPDNATGHAWAVHAFVLLWALRGSAEADLHAQTLLHACTRATGRPDRFSALLLLDAADALETWAERRPRMA